ncbi:MAG TPA: UDP binding domain-containing protein, partial [Chitinophagaceae bacterium]|nr:UDP binding domain-containing protein [Chitinophagaceae bacterium]
IGVGGHCTPVYPYFLIENFREVGLDFSLALQGRLINNQMADYAVSLVNDKIQIKRALILGLGFRPNVKEDSLSTTYRLHEVLTRLGYRVLVHDTEYSLDEIRQKGFNPAADIYNSGAEVIFLVTMHREYHDLDLRRLSESGSRYFVDGRNNIDKSKVQQAGMEYFGIGH